MSSIALQALVLIRATVAGIPRRAAISLSMVLSIALVVTVLAGFLALAAGLRQTLGAGGSNQVAIVLAEGTTQETASSIPPEAVRSIEATGVAAGIARDAAGRTQLSREILVPVEVGQAEGVARMVTFRGMDSVGLTLRGDAVTLEGSAFALGTREVVIGSRLARDLGSGTLGRTVRLGPVDWTVAGVLSAGGAAAESEIWGDLEAVRAVFDRQGETQTLRVGLEGETGLARLQAALPEVSRTPLAVMTETAFLAGQSARIERLVTFFGWPIALLMAIGATAGALNTMSSSVSARTGEIATFRVLGFSRRAAFAATFAEALLLSLAGAVLGAAVSWLVLDGWQASTLSANETQLAFQLAVTPTAMAQAGLVALLIGCIGGALPALAATRLPLAAALRN